MDKMNLRTVQTATTGKILRGERTLELTGISTDTRTLRPGELFFALCGDNHDAHRFLPDVAARGAGAAVIHNAKAAGLAPGLPVVLVKDTTRALGDLAHWHRKQCPTTVIGITGSNGKTTAKEMLFHILDGVVRSVKSIYNFNNHVGVPLTLFQLRPQDVYAVVEMGTNAPGEIARLCEIADPDLGLITNVGESHLEGLGDLEGVAREKSAILKHTARRGGAFFNADDYWSRRMAKHLQGTMVAFGLQNEATLRGFNVRCDRSGISFKIVDGPRIHLPVPGLHNASNALAAIAVARKLGIDWATIGERLSTFHLPPKRMELTTVGDVTMINDAYNANPASMEAAARTLERTECVGRKILVVGDMLELGSGSADLHRRAGQMIAGHRFHYLLGVGPHAAELIAAAREHAMARNKLYHAGSNEELAEALVRIVAQGDTVLFKGSRGMKLEEVADALQKHLGATAEKAAPQEETPIYGLYRSAENTEKTAAGRPGDVPAARTVA